MYKQNSRHIAKVVGRSLKQHSVSFFQDIKNDESNSYFVKIMTFRLHTGKLLENRRKGYILDVCYVDFILESFREKFSARALGRVSQHPEQQVYVSIKGLLQKENKVKRGEPELCGFSVNQPCRFHSFFVKQSDLEGC